MVPDEVSSGMKKCAYCSEEVKIDAVRCRYCQGDLLKSPHSLMRQSQLAFLIGVVVLLAPLVLPRYFGIEAMVLGVIMLIAGARYRANELRGLRPAVSEMETPPRIERLSLSKIFLLLALAVATFGLVSFLVFSASAPKPHPVPMQPRSAKALLSSSEQVRVKSEAEVARERQAAEEVAALAAAELRKIEEEEARERADRERFAQEMEKQALAEQAAREAAQRQERVDLLAQVRAEQERRQAQEDAALAQWKPSYRQALGPLLRSMRDASQALRLENRTSAGNLCGTMLREEERVRPFVETCPKANVRSTLSEGLRLVREAGDQCIGGSLTIAQLRLLSALETIPQD